MAAFDAIAGCGHHDHMARNVVGARELLPSDASVPSVLLKLASFRPIH
jgi:hypothetical protein